MHREATGFAEALMEVSVPARPHSHIAMLYEVQRLAQNHTRLEMDRDPFHAAIAYDVAAARQQIDAGVSALPVLRV